MSSYYSKDNTYPQTLPVDLQSLSTTELNGLGWYGPITMPPLPGTTGMTHRYEWDTSSRSFSAIELDTDTKRSLVQYDTLYENIIDTNFYSSLRTLAKTQLAVNSLLTEFLILIGEARNGNIYETKIQTSITELLAEVTLSDDDMTELQNTFFKSGMNGIYTLS